MAGTGVCGPASFLESWSRSARVKISKKLPNGVFICESKMEFLFVEFKMEFLVRSNNVNRECDQNSRIRDTITNTKILNDTQNMRDVGE